MRTRFLSVLLALILAVPTFAESVGAFKKFSLGAMFGIGASYLTGEDKDLYDDGGTFGMEMTFRMALPLNNVLSVVTDIGVDGVYGYASEYEYQYRSFVDSIETTSVGVSVLLTSFVSDHVFLSIGPSIRIPFLKEMVKLEDETIYSGDPGYANDLWLDVVGAIGWKYNGVELGMRTGYEFLGLYKETKDFHKVDLNELRFRIYFSYWFGQRN